MTSDDDLQEHRRQTLAEFERILRADLTAAGIRPSVIDAAVAELLPRAAAALDLSTERVRHQLGGGALQ